MRTHILGDWAGDLERRALARALDGASSPVAVSWTAGPELPDDAAAIRVLVAGRPTGEQLDACRSLQSVIVPWAGLPADLRPLILTRPDLSLHNLHHNAAPTAEAAVTLLLAAARRLVPCDAALRRGDWRPRYDGEPSVTLAGRSAAVLGYGAVGRRVARILTAMEMNVRAVRRRTGAAGHAAADGAGADSGATGDTDSIDLVAATDAATVRRAVAGCHALVICLPLTPRTEHLVDGPLLDVLAEPALLVNVGRGGIVDEDALYERLADGRIFGAGLDVWWRYPASEEERERTAPSARPYGDLDSVVLSPHRGGHEVEADEAARRMAGLASLLLALAAGRRETNRVDPEAGY